VSTNEGRARRSRGAGLYGVKPAFVARLRGVEDLAARRGVSPDALTLLGAATGVVTGAVVAAGSVEPLLWLVVPPLVLARMVCNAVDGSLARRTGATTPRGAVLNELGDRTADLVTFAGLAPAVGAPLALGVMTVALATSFVAVTSEAVLGTRLAIGPLGKPDRVAVLAAAAAVAPFAGPSALRIGAWMIVGLGVVTIARRAGSLWRAAGATP
jgi:CDP-diacylglycerol--glycerol-3-phosphate 3-phosphatidyltransferase